jgi:hypothetical protein
MAPAAIAQPWTGAGAERDWPRTGRVLPWLAAALIAMLFLVPIDSVTLPGGLPFDARPDRVLLVVAFLTWALVLAVGAPGRRAGEAHRYGTFEVLLLVFVGLAIMSVALRLDALHAVGEASGAAKRLVLLTTYVAFYLFIVANVRTTEVPAFVRLVVGLATLTAIGTIVELGTQYNVFYEAAAALAPPGTVVAPHADLVAPGGRPDITGPARHGLADCTLLAMVLPLAVVGSRWAPGRRERLLYGLAALIIFVGSVATVRRSGVILPFVASSAVVLLGGRRMVPVAAVFVVLLLALPLAAPDTIQALAAQFSAADAAAQRSIGGRTADYAAVWPDVRHGALLGRGFGTYEAARYRFLDNQYLGLLIGTGFIGAAAFVAMVLAAGGIALRVGLSSWGPTAWVGLATFGAILAFLLANALFDALAFPHAPYGFFLLAAFAVIARRATRAGALIGRDPPA